MVEGLDGLVGKEFGDVEGVCEVSEEQLLPMGKPAMFIKGEQVGVGGTFSVVDWVGGLSVVT